MFTAEVIHTFSAYNYCFKCKINDNDKLSGISQFTLEEKSHRYIFESMKTSNVLIFVECYS